MTAVRTPATVDGKHPLRVRKALFAALALSLLIHLLWTLWPVESTDTPEGTVLTATLTEMPPPPVPQAQPAAASPEPKPTRGTTARPRRHVPAPSTSTRAEVEVPAQSPSISPAKAEAPAALPAIDLPAAVGTDEPPPPPVVLPPRVDLAYKVFFGTNGFVIGEATYRFEHTGDRYRISTVGQARGLAALIVRGTGKLESHGQITPSGLKPYEFAIERGSADRREVAYFDWDAGSVVLQDGATEALEAPAFDPLTIMWQPYFSPPGKAEQTFTLATTRKVARYTLTLQDEETIRGPRGDIATERWHRRSEDGNTDAWFWLAPSMHYIPVKMRITRTSRGTLEALLSEIRVDGDDAASSAAVDAINGTAAQEPRTASDIVYGMPQSGLPPMRAEDLHGQ